MAKLITPEGKVTEVQPDNGTDFSLEEMRGHIGCSMIQICEGKDGKILVFDEEFLCRGDLKRHPTMGIVTEEYNPETGKRHIKPWLNRKATDAMHPRMGPYQYNVVCGNALLCEDSEVQ